jgi:hypothetical protein
MARSSWLTYKKAVAPELANPHKNPRSFIHSSLKMVLR